MQAATFNALTFFISCKEIRSDYIIFVTFFSTKSSLAQSAGAVEYTDCISAEG